MVLHRRWQFARDWSGVPLWPVPMTVLAAVWLAAAVGLVGERQPGMPLAPHPATGASVDRAAGAPSGAASHGPSTTQPTGAAAAAHGNHPTRYRVSHDAQAELYSVVLEGLALRR